MEFALVRRRFLRVCAIVCLIGAGATPNAGERAWALGPDPNATILVFDISGGQRPRAAEGPLLEIAASGAASARAARPGEPRISAQFSATKLAALLDVVVVDLGAFEIDADEISAVVAGAGDRRTQISDASTTSLTLALGDRRTRISVYALPQQASLHPENDALQRFLAIRRLLRSEAAAIAANAGAKPCDADGTVRPGAAD